MCISCQQLVEEKGITHVAQIFLLPVRGHDIHFHSCGAQIVTVGTTLYVLCPNARVYRYWFSNDVVDFANYWNTRACRLLNKLTGSDLALDFSGFRERVKIVPSPLVKARQQQGIPCCTIVSNPEPAESDALLAYTYFR